MALVQKQFGDLITFTRASGGGRTNPAGNFEWLAANAPRFDYDPITKLARGLLIEESRTNLLTYSEQLDNAAWSKLDATVSIDDKVSPLGSLGQRVTVSGPNAFVNRTLPTTPTVPLGSTVTASFLVARGDFDWMRLSAQNYSGSNLCQAWFNLATGAKGNVITAGTATGASSTITPAGGGYYWCTVTVTLPDDTQACSSFAAVTSNGGGARPPIGSFVRVAALDLELGAFGTSYIPTGATQVTRAAETVRVNTLSPWFNASEGTLFVEGSTSSKGNAYLASLAMDGGNYINLRQQDSARAEMRVAVGSSAVAVITESGTGALASNSKMAGAYKLNDFAASLNGVLLGTDNSGGLPLVSYLGIGHAAFGINANGYIRALRYYPRRLSNAELQALTV